MESPLKVTEPSHSAIVAIERDGAPEDVMKTAKLWAYHWLPPHGVRTSLSSEEMELLEEAASELVAAAILAERERCASLTTKYSEDTMQPETRLVAQYLRREIIRGDTCL